MIKIIKRWRLVGSEEPTWSSFVRTMNYWSEHILKRTVLFLGLVLLMTLAACGGSPEAKELKEYHEKYADNVDSNHNEIYHLLTEAENASDLQMEYSINKEKVQPIVEEIHQFVNGQNPETDAVKELHKIRVKEYNTWKEAFDQRLEALKLALNTSLENPEVNQLLDKFDEKITESNELGVEANEKLLKLVDEYGLKLEANSETNSGE